MKNEVWARDSRDAQGEIRRQLMLKFKSQLMKLCYSLNFYWQYFFFLEPATQYVFSFPLPPTIKKWGERNPNKQWWSLKGSPHAWQSWVEMPRATLGTHEQMHHWAKKELRLITQIVFIKRLMAQGAHQTLYKGILLLQIEKYKIAPKAIQYICGYLDTTQYPTASKYPVFPNQHKDGRKRLRQSNIVPCKECCLFKNNSDLI